MIESSQAESFVSYNRSVNVHMPTCLVRFARVLVVGPATEAEESEWAGQAVRHVWHDLAGRCAGLEPSTEAL